jgi:hypothetical protein
LGKTVAVWDALGSNRFPDDGVWVPVFGFRKYTDFEVLPDIDPPVSKNCPSGKRVLLCPSNLVDSDGVVLSWVCCGLEPGPDASDKTEFKTSVARVNAPVMMRLLRVVECTTAIIEFLLLITVAPFLVCVVDGFTELSV